MDDYNTKIIEVDGYFFCVRENTIDEKLIMENFVKKYYEKYFAIEKSDIWIDIGAYIGDFTMSVVRSEAKVCAFEPHPSSYELLQKNMLINNIDQNLYYLSNRAIVPNIEQKNILLYPFSASGNIGGSTTVNRWKRPRPTIQVECIDFVSALLEAKAFFNVAVNCIKMDIEGAEMQILEAMNDDAMFHVRKLVFEYHFFADRSVDRFWNIIHQLQFIGFTNVKFSRSVPKTGLWNFPRIQFMQVWMWK